MFEATVIRMGIQQAHQMEGRNGLDVHSLMQNQLARFLLENQDEIQNTTSRGAVHQILSFLMGGLPVELRDDEEEEEEEEEEQEDAEHDP